MGKEKVSKLRKYMLSRKPGKLKRVTRHHETRAIKMYGIDYLLPSASTLQQS